MPVPKSLRLLLALAPLSLFPITPAQASGHDGWTGYISTHSVGTFTIRRHDGDTSNTADHKETRDARIFFNPDGSISTEGAYFEEETQHINYGTWSSDAHNIDHAKGGGPSTDDPSISLNDQNHFLINVQQITIDMPGNRAGFDTKGDTKSHKNTWNDPTNFSVSCSDAEDANSKPGDTHLDGSHTSTEPGNDDGQIQTITTVTWHLTLKENLRLRITADNYDTWQPIGTTDESKKGNTLHLHAKLQNKDGSSPSEKADFFTFELLDTSAIPGTAINFPKKSSAAPKKDLKFEPSENAALDIQGDDAQLAQTKTPQQTEADATISCFDWGAYGKIRVTAHIGTRVIIGYLEQDLTNPHIRLPKRAANSNIADAWKSAHSVPADALDNADTDDTPKSNVLDGDGLSLYEEYRGFYENGGHKQGDPHAKDLFIRDKSSATPHKCQAGLDMLASLTGIQIHSKFTDDEFPTNRIINFNIDPTAHTVDQHGIILTSNETPGDSETAGHNGHLRCPADLERPIEIHAINPAIRGPANAALEFNIAVAHEILHALGVDHHGDDDPAVMEWVQTSPNQITEYTLVPGPNDTTTRAYGVPITIAHEDGTPFAPAEITSAMTLPSKIYIAAEKNGEHSGDVNCIMRYNCCNAYKKGDKRIWLEHYEPLTVGLCTDPKGTDYNASTNPNGSRHGDAAPNRGNCKAQIVINDKRAQQ